MTSETRKIIKFFFQTSNGPGEVVISIGPDTTIEQAGEALLSKFRPLYKEIEIVAHIELDSYGNQ